MPVQKVATLGGNKLTDTGALSNLEKYGEALLTAQPLEKDMTFVHAGKIGAYNPDCLALIIKGTGARSFGQSFETAAAEKCKCVTGRVFALFWFGNPFFNRFTNDRVNRACRTSCKRCSDLYFWTCGKRDLLCSLAQSRSSGSLCTNEHHPQETCDDRNGFCRGSGHT